GAGPVEEVADGARYPVLVAGDRLRAERGQRQPAQPGVIGRVHLQEGQVELVRFGGGAGVREAHAEAPVAQHPVAYAMARAHPVAQAGGDQRAALADPVVDRVRIGPARAQPEQRHRIPVDVAGIGRIGALEVEAGDVRDGAAGVVHLMASRYGCFACASALTLDAGAPALALGGAPAPCRKVPSARPGASRGASLPWPTDSAAT